MEESSEGKNMTIYVSCYQSVHPHPFQKRSTTSISFRIAKQKRTTAVTKLVSIDCPKFWTSVSQINWMAAIAKITLTSLTLTEQSQHLYVSSWLLFLRWYSHFFCVPTRRHSRFGQNTSTITSIDKSRTDFRKFLFFPFFW